MIQIHNPAEIEELLSQAAVIAVVGLSPKPERPSNGVARYLIDAGYTVLPVNPGHESILDRRCYSSLLDIEQPVDIVDIFRRAEDVEPIVQQAIEIGSRAIWMQQGIINHLAAERARLNGLQVIMDRCIKVDHKKLIANR